MGKAVGKAKAGTGAAPVLVLPGSKPPPPPGRVVPIGRHGRPHEEIRAIQRDRILNAFVATVGRVGLAKAYVNDVCSQARVSTKEFYDTFLDKDDCFNSAFDLGSRLVFDQAALAYDQAEGRWEDRVRAMLTRVLNTLATNPAFARLCTVEAYDFGPPATDRLAAIGRRYRHAFGGPAGPNPSVPLPRHQLDAILTGSTFRPITEQVREGQAEQLPELVPGLMYFITLNTLGTERAMRQLELGNDRSASTGRKPPPR